jgi:hypothetical protein
MVLSNRKTQKGKNMKFSIYQAQISREAMDKINAVGWDGDFGDHELEARIIRDVKFTGGSKGYTPDMSEYYEIVGMVEAIDLDEVFHIGNIAREKIRMIADKMSSISVGDIIECHDTGDCFMVDDFGFTAVEFLEVA